MIKPAWAIKPQEPQGWLHSRLPRHRVASVHPKTEPPFRSSSASGNRPMIQMTWRTCMTWRTWRHGFDRQHSPWRDLRPDNRVDHVVSRASSSLQHREAVLDALRARGRHSANQLHQSPTPSDRQEHARTGQRPLSTQRVWVSAHGDEVQLDTRGLLGSRQGPRRVYPGGEGGAEEGAWSQVRSRCRLCREKTRRILSVVDGRGV